MIVVMKADATDGEINRVIETIESLGYRPHVSRGVERCIIGAIGDERGKSRLHSLEALPGVESVVPILKPYKLASKQVKDGPSRYQIDGVEIGGTRIVVVAGPCSVESRDQILETARAVKAAGASMLRGGAFKPRTSPYSFQGLGEEGLKLLQEAKAETGLPIQTEVMAPEDVELVARYADVIQIGARNVQNFKLLRRVGEFDIPVCLKRGLSTTIEELLMAAEYILSEGNQKVILCERGIRTFETATRNTLDLNAVPVLKHETHLPVIVDPSHGTGHWRYVTPMAQAAVAAGADGLLIEVHPRPHEAFSDGAQSLKFDNFVTLMQRVAAVAEAVGRSV
ncbi:MAG: 3-deoxy-7-phosphoheptulonate synthase [Nitrospinota bacterium]|nr:MAG: 3-deoxy-7-phosphoheptulonate synthase [Nitrospinota bacterium]